MLIADLMTSPAVTVPADLTVKSAAQVLREHDVAAAPVVDDDGVLVGIVSEIDLLRGSLVPDPVSHLLPVPDPGPAPATVGAGGTLTELLDDQVVRLPAATVEQAVEQVEQLRCARLLHGFRGRPPLDVRAAAEVLVALGALACDLPEIGEVDLNPLLVLPTGAVCLDARVRVGPARVGAGLFSRDLTPPRGR